MFVYFVHLSCNAGGKQNFHVYVDNKLSIVWMDGKETCVLFFN